MLSLAPLFLASLIALSAAPALAQSEEDVAASIETVQGDADGFFELFAAAQDALLLDDPAAIADLIEYPIDVRANGEVYTVLSPEDFLADADILFPPSAQEAIGMQDVGDLIVTSEGVGFGNGEVWAANLCDDESCESTYWAITAINE